MQKCHRQSINLHNDGAECTWHGAVACCCRSDLRLRRGRLRGRSGETGTVLDSRSGSCAPSGEGDHNTDVDDRFRRHPRHRGAADMLDGEEGGPAATSLRSPMSCPPRFLGAPPSRRHSVREVPPENRLRFLSWMARTAFAECPSSRIHRSRCSQARNGPALPGARRGLHSGRRWPLWPPCPA